MCVALKSSHLQCNSHLFNDAHCKILFHGKSFRYLGVKRCGMMNFQVFVKTLFLWHNFCFDDHDHFTLNPIQFYNESFIVLAFALDIFATWLEFQPQHLCNKAWLLNGLVTSSFILKFFIFHHVLYCVKKMKMIVFHEEIFYDLSLNNEIQMGFPLNSLDFLMFLYYICVNNWKKFKNKFPFVSFEQDMKKYIYVRIWFVK
jgi:hypothetical protein